MSALEISAAKLRGWRQNVSKFAWDNFRFKPDPWQKEAFDVFPSQDPDKLRISLQACAGPGKTAVLAICGLNFIGCYGDKGEHPKGAAVSITGDNLKDNLWPEFSRWMDRSAYFQSAFTWSHTRIFAKDHPNDWFIAARSWSKSANPEEQGRTLSGLHSKYVICLFDESGEIPLPVARAGDQALSNCKWGKLLQGGNPTSQAGMLYYAAKNPHLWYCIRVTGDPDDPKRSSRINKEQAAQHIRDHGRDNPWVMAYILGLFPPSSINSLLGPDEVAAAMKRGLRSSDYDFAQKRLGVDVARFGNDRTILAPRQGLQAFSMEEMRNARGPEVAARVALARERWDQELTFIDDTGGFGGSVCDSCLQAGIPHIPVNFSGKAIDPRYFNKRAEMHFLAAEWVKRGGALPNDPDLVREATASTYTLRDGKLMIVDKAIVKKLLGFSPDKWDAFVCTFALPEMPAEKTPEGVMMRRGPRMASDWDPLASDGD